MRLLPALILGVPLMAQLAAPVQDRANRFLKVVNDGYQSLTYVARQAVWEASTDVKPEHDAGAEWAGKAFAAFNGNPALITEARELLQHRAELNDLTVRQLERVLLNAAEDLSTRAMVDYFKPLMAWLEEQNKGRQIGWD
jgi:peptidyl-dipeptidase A